MKNIYVFGDSLVYGQGDTQFGGWVSRLQEKLGAEYRFKNFGVPGDTSIDLLNRIEKELNESNPDLIVISIGANDSQYRNEKNKTLIDIETFKENLEKIFNIGKKESKKIIFVGIPQMDDSITTNWHYSYYFSNKNISKFNKEIKNFCESKKIKYVDIFNTITSEDLSDGAHPNSNGYQKIMEKIYKTIDFNVILQ